MIDRLVASELVWCLGWTLLHSVWQLSLIGALVSLALAMLSRRSANVRYAVACGGLASLYIPLVLTFLSTSSPSVLQATLESPGPQLGSEPRPAAGSPSQPVAPAAFPPDANHAEAKHAAAPGAAPGPADFDSISSTHLVSTREPMGFAARFSQLAAPWLSWIVGGWVAIVALLALSNVGGWIVVLRLRRLAAPLTTSAAAERLRELASQMQIDQPVQLLASTQIDAPMMIGWLKPAVLLPSSLLSGLTPAELDAILAHELAHVRRYDYLINLLQTLTEMLLFFHPVVWLLSQRIRREREYCCDDAAITVCGSRLDYVRALATIEASRQPPQYAMTFLGRSRSMTLDRVRRLMGASVSFPNTWLNGSGALLMLVAILFTIVLTRTGSSVAHERTERWGEAVDGVQVRLVKQRGPSRADSPPTLMFAVRNRGNRDLFVTLFQEPCEIELDGRWYSWSEGFARNTSPLPPRQKYSGVRVSLGGSWRSKSGEALPLTVGKHTIRLALPVRSPDTKAPGALPHRRVVSNPIEIEIVGDSEKAAATASKRRHPWGEAVQGVQLRLRATPRKGIGHPTKVPAWVVGQTPGFDVDVRNQGDANVNFLAHRLACELQYDGRWYVSSGKAPLNQPSSVLSPGDSVQDAIHLQLDPGGWVAKNDHADLELTPGKHTVRVALRCDEDIRLMSTPVFFRIVAGPDQNVLTSAAATGPAPLAPQNGVFVLAGTHSSTVLELNNGKFRYWFENDVKLRPPREYPLEGDYSVRGQTIMLHNDLILESESKWVLRKLNGNTTAWNLPAVEYYKNEKKLSPYGILQLTVQSAEEAVKTLRVPARIQSRQKEWPANEHPRFTVDVRNHSGTTFRLSPRQPAHEIELDGTWYDWALAVRILSGAFQPGAVSTGIEFTLDPKFWRVQGESDAAAFQLTPGQHTVRVAIVLHAPSDPEKRWRTVTDKFVFHIAAKQPGQEIKSGESEIPAGSEDEPGQLIREGKITWRRQGKEKHVWISEATDEILASLADPDDITYLNLFDSRPNGLGTTPTEAPSRKAGMTNAGLAHVARLKNLRSLTLPERGVTDEGLVHLQDMQSLRELWLDFIPLTDKGVAHLKKLTRLRVLRFHGAKITDKGMENFREMLDLEDLQLGLAVITDESMPIIGKMTRLKTLDLRVNVTDKGLVHLRDLSDLDWLCLSGTAVGDRGLVHVGRLQKLEWLLLEGTQVTDAGLKQISELANLTTLYLSDTAITDAGVDSIVRLSSLERLKLNNTKITDQGLGKFAAMKQLKELQIRGTQVTGQAIEALREACPDLEIITDIPPAAKNVLRDGGFESPDNGGVAYRPYAVGRLGAWRVASGSVDLVGNYWKPAAGRQSLDLSGLQGSPGTIYQDIVTVPGQRYRIRFSAAGNPEPEDITTPKVMTAYWNERKIATLKLSAQGHDFQNVGWQEYEFEVQAQGTSSRLKFTSLTRTPCGPILDEVSVTPLVD